MHSEYHGLSRKKGMNGSRYVLVPSRVKLHSMTQPVLRNKSQGEGLWKSLSCDETEECACPWRGSSSFSEWLFADPGLTACLGDKVALSGLVPIFSLTPWRQRPLQSLPALLFCLKTSLLLSLPFYPNLRTRLFISITKHLAGFRIEFYWVCRLIWAEHCH